MEINTKDQIIILLLKKKDSIHLYNEDFTYFYSIIYILLVKQTWKFTKKVTIDLKVTLCILLEYKSEFTLKKDFIMRAVSSN